MHDYQKIAAIVGEDKIEALREAGVEIADKPAKPTTGLLGRWAKHPEHSDVLVVSEHVNGAGRVWVTFGDKDSEDGTTNTEVRLSSLTFPEETTRPKDVPVGEAWLVDVDEGTSKGKGIPAVKSNKNDWATGYVNAMTWWEDREVTLIAPLVPARPVDSDREPETVTTEEEYAALPFGSIVAEQRGVPYCRERDTWFWADMPFSHRDLAGVTRTVLRKGRGE